MHHPGPSVRLWQRRCEAFGGMLKGEFNAAPEVPCWRTYPAVRAHLLEALYKYMIVLFAAYDAPRNVTEAARHTSLYAARADALSAGEMVMKEGNLEDSDWLADMRRSVCQIGCDHDDHMMHGYSARLTRLDAFGR